MRSLRIKRTLIVSTAVILLCMTVIVGMTFALFTDTKTVVNHLQAGDLNLKLERIALTKTTLDSEGYLAEVVEQKETDTPVDFTAANKNNVFGMDDHTTLIPELIVPGSEFAAKMRITNESDVAVDYWIELIRTDGQPVNDALLEQLEIKVIAADGTTVLVNGLGSVSDTYTALGQIVANGTAEFTVTLKFVNTPVDYQNGELDSDNNKAKNKEIKFDLVVHAVQATAKNP